MSQKLINGGEAHEYHAGEQQASAAFQELCARARLEAKCAAGSGARWWVEGATGFTGSTGFGRLSSVDRGNAVRATLEGRSNSVKTTGQGLGLEQMPRMARFCVKLSTEAEWLEVAKLKAARAAITEVLRMFQKDEAPKEDVSDIIAEESQSD